MATLKELFNSLENNFVSSDQLIAEFTTCLSNGESFERLKFSPVITFLSQATELQHSGVLNDAGIIDILRFFNSHNVDFDEALLEAVKGNHYISFSFSQEMLER